MSRTNETKNIEWHGACKCECRLDAIICNDKQHWNNDKCKCECKVLIDKGVCDKGYTWNPSNCKCECDKSCDIGECIAYEKCTCKKRLADKLVDECTETIEKVKPAIITLAENSYKCSSCTVYIVLLWIFFIIILGIGAYFAYYKHRKRNKKMFLDIMKQLFTKLINGRTKTN